MKHSEETKKKLSEARKGEGNPMFGKKFSEETKRKMSQSHKYIVFTEEWRKNISEALTGKKLSEDHRRSLTLAKLGIKNHNYGKPMSEKQKTKLSIIQKGRDRSNGNFTYRALHKRMNKLIPKPDLCQICNKVPPQELSNKDHKYMEIKEDWQWLCRSCHKIHDGRINNN